MWKPIFVIASAAVAAAASHHAAAQPAGSHAVSRIAVHTGHYVVDGVAIDGIDALQAVVGNARGTPMLEFDLCSDGAARAWMAAAHRLRHERQRVRAAEAGTAHCPTPLLQPVSSAPAARPISDEAAAGYWRALLP